MFFSTLGSFQLSTSFVFCLRLSKRFRKSVSFFLLVTWPSAAVSAISEALRQSNAQFCSADVLGRLSVKLRSSERGDIGVGWDVFLLDYAIDSPLHATRQNSIHRENCTCIGDSEGVFQCFSWRFNYLYIYLHIFTYTYIMQFVDVYNYIHHVQCNQCIGTCCILHAVCA